MEQVVAVIGKEAISAGPDRALEAQLSEQISTAERQAAEIVIINEAGYSAAGDFLRTVKRVQKSIKEYWEPLRVAAKSAYDGVISRKKGMTDPLDKAEAVVKRKMADYTMEQERKRQEEERRIRELLRAEAEKRLADAVAAEAAGDASGAAYALDDAEMMDSRADSATVVAEKAKADGVSLRKSWRINVVDPAKVPVSVNGVEIRPVDKAAVMRAVKAADGKISIPGIEIVEDVTVVART